MHPTQRDCVKLVTAGRRLGTLPAAKRKAPPYKTPFALQTFSPFPLSPPPVRPPTFVSFPLSFFLALPRPVNRLSSIQHPASPSHSFQHHNHSQCSSLPLFSLFPPSSTRAWPPLYRALNRQARHTLNGADARQRNPQRQALPLQSPSHLSTSTPLSSTGTRSKLVPMLVACALLR